MTAAVRVGISSVEASAIVQADADDRGLLVPRVTTAQRDAIASPATGLLVWNTDNTRLEEYNGSAWVAVGSAAPGLSTIGEIMLTAAGGWPSTTGGCASNAKVEHATNGVNLYVLDFDPATDEYAQWTVWMPVNWDGGTVTFQVAWTAAAGVAGATVEWNLQGRSYANGDAIDASWGLPVEVSDALIAADEVHITAESGAVTLAGGPAGGELVQFRLYRDAVNDTLVEDARLLGVKVYYTRT